MRWYGFLLVGLMLMGWAETVKAARPAPFSVSAEKAQKTSSDTWVFTVSAPVPGNYRLVVNGIRPAAAPQSAMIGIELDSGSVKSRPLIVADQKQGRIDAIRVLFADQSAHRIAVTSTAATVTKLDFVPMKKASIPSAAAKYLPKVVPPSTHPRVLVNAALLPELRHRLTAAEDLPVWERVKKIALTPYVFQPSPKQEVKYDEPLVNAVRCKAFYYLIAGDQAVGKEAIQLLRRYMAQVDFGLAQDISREIGDTIFTSALVYDWCYRLLTPDDRNFFMERYFYFAEEMEIGWPPFLEPALYGHANEAQISRDLLSMAIAMYDENPVPYKLCSYGLMEVSAPAKNYLYRSGRHDQGTAYGNYRFCWDLHAALLYKRMADYDLFLPELASRIPYRWVYQRTPDGKLFKEGDDFFNGDYTGNFLMNLVAAALYRDPTLKEEFRRIDASGTVDPVFFLLVNDPELQAVDHRRELPLTCYYPSPLGAMVARTGWNLGLAADDVIVSMLGAGFYYRNHQHLDAGSFQIYYRGLLLADLGLYRGYGSPYDWNFHKSTPSHTAMLIRDPDQKENPMGPRFSANSGTQEAATLYPPASLGEQLSGDYFRNGEVTAHGFGPDPMVPEYSFLTTDMTLSYKSRVDNYARTMIFLNLAKNSTPAVLLVYDTMKLKAERSEPIFQLTSPVRPVLDDRTLTFVNAPYGRPGKLVVKTLLPLRTDVKMQSGRELFTVDGRAYIPGAFNDFSKAGTRVMITAGKGEDKTHFLNVLEIQQGDAHELPVAWSENAGRIGVQLADRVVNFSRSGDAMETIDYHQEKSEARVLFLNLKPGKWNLEKGALKTGFEVDPASGSFFTVLDAGDYRLSRVAAAVDQVSNSTEQVKTAATVTAPPPQNRIWFDGTELGGKEENNGEILLPLKALLELKKQPYQATASTLTFTLDGQKVTLTAGKNELDFGTWRWPVKMALQPGSNGEWLVPAAVAAALLHATFAYDRWTGSVFLTSLTAAETTKFLALSCPPEAIPSWRQLWTTGRSRWNVPGQGIAGEVVFRQPEMLSGIAFLRGDGNVHRAKFKMEISADGRTFTKVFAGESSGNCVSYEPVKFAPQSVRIIRLTFDGNDANEWNGLLGVQLLPAAAAK